MEKFSMERLGCDNYESWSFQLKSLLMREELWRYVTNDAPEPVTEAWTNGDAKTQGTISLFVGITQQSLIRKCTTAKQIWETLRDHHQKTSLTSKVSILKRICNLTYSDGDDMERHVHEMEDLFQRLANAGLELGATLTVVLILRSLPASFETLTTALESRPEDELTMDIVKRKLLDEALKRSERSGRGESILRVEAKSIVCHHCKQTGHVKKNCPTLGRKTDPKQKDVARQPKPGIAFDPIFRSFEQDKDQPMGYHLSALGSIFQKQS